MTIYEHIVAGVTPGALVGSLSYAANEGRRAVEAAGGQIFGLWKPLIGLSLNHVVAVVVWPAAVAPGRGAQLLLGGATGVQVEQNDQWQATLRPTPEFRARHTEGFVTHRWYYIDERGLDQFLKLSSSAWGNWEGTHDGEVLGLWRSLTPPGAGLVRMRLMAWYRDMSVWERSRHWKGTKGAETANANLGARYDMTLDSAVSILQPVPL